ncbi:MAG: ABC transporter permease [Deltaproteobacteria bacterium]|nr:ABC transporter permease [Deltaproteobacteria bacterium]
MQLKKLKIFVPIVILLLWQLFSSLNIISHYTTPSPWEVSLSIKTLATVGLPQGYKLLTHILESLYRVFWGFSIAILIAVPLGIFMGWSKTLRELLNPLVEIVRPIPPLAWIPIAIFWFGIGIKSAAFIIFLGSFFPILLSTVSGVLSVDTVLIDASLTLGARRSDIYRKILIPGATPSIYTGLRIGMGIAWMTLIAAEFTGVKSGYGLGYMIMVARDIQRPDHIVAGMAIIGTIGYLLDVFLKTIERKVLKWR